MGLAIGADEAVYAEVGVVGLVAEVAAEGEVLPALFVASAQALIDPNPTNIMCHGNA